MVAAGSAPSCPRQGSGEIDEIFMKLYGVSFPDSMGYIKKEYDIELLSLPCLRGDTEDAGLPFLHDSLATNRATQATQASQAKAFMRFVVSEDKASGFRLYRNALRDPEA